MCETLFITDKVKTHETISFAYLSLGQYYLNVGNFDKAFLSFNSAHEMNSTLFEYNYKSEHSAIVQSGTWLARAYLATGQFKKAEQLFTEAHNMNLLMFKKFNNSNYSDIAESAQQLADFNAQIGKYNECVQFNQLAINIYKFFSDNYLYQIKYANSQLKLGEAHLKFAYLDKSLELCLLSHEIKQNFYNEHSSNLNHLTPLKYQLKESTQLLFKSELAKSLNAIGSVYIRYNDSKQVLQYLLKSFHDIEKISNISQTCI